jgi:anti-anti-sigma regulatory factor
MGKLLQNRLRLPACRILTVNAEGVVYIDVAGIATLLEVLKAARLLGKRLVLKGLRESRLLHLFNGEGDRGAGVDPAPTTTL